MRHLLLLLALFTLLLPASANPPAWWLDGHPSVVDVTTEPNYHGPANVGQAKWMATEALRALDVASPQLAADIRLDLKGTSPSNRIVDLTEPDQKTPEWIANQKAALLLGQLKAIARPFYNRLNVVSPTWVQNQIQQNHDNAAILGTDYWQVSGNSNYTQNGYYPWNPAAPAESNSTLATIGQLKVIFSFDPTMIPLPPEVILLAPVAYTIEDHAILTARVTAKAGATITLLKLNGLTVPADPTYPVTLINGLNTFTLVATDSAGHSGSATATITRDTALPQLAITSPSNGAVIQVSSINVIGTFGGGVPMRSVIVNGVRAYLHAGTFEAPHVTIANGANTITATATDILDRVATVSISVTGQTPGSETSVVMTAIPSTGDAPLSATFNTVATVPGTIQLVTYDFEGTGKNLVTATSITSMVHIYGESGIYYPRIIVQTTIGAFSNNSGPGVPLTERLRVVVKPAAGGNTPLDAWTLFKKWVAAGDFEAAAECMDSANRDTIKQTMSELGPVAATRMLEDFGQLQEIKKYDDCATYAGEIAIPEGAITFLVDFVNVEGSWKIFSF